MSPSSLYQSRLLSFLSRQSLRFKGKSTQLLRQVRTATVWSAQILLYPAYLLFQAGRLTSRQLQQEIRQGFPLLRAGLRSVPPADVPVQKVLQVAQTLYPEADQIQTLSDGEHSSWEGNCLPLPQPPRTLQGIACLLETQSVVLVAVQNQILDILTPAQQHKISQHLIWEISDYYHQRKSLALQHRSVRALPPPRQSLHLLPPLQVFRQLMGWVQQGPVASRIDLFQESTRLPPAHPPAPRLDSPPTSLPPASPDFGRGVQSRTQQLRSLEASYVRQSEPWLTLSDLFGTAAPAQPLPTPDPLLMLQTPEPQPLALVSAHPMTHVVHGEASTRQNTNSTLQPAPLPANPDWLEVDVQPIGYVKHPLEQLVGWLDRVILWVEKGLERLNQWMRRHWLN